MMILQGDTLTILKTLDDETVDCIVTSPPYYALRDYGLDGQIGLEKSPEDYIWRLIEIFDEIKRVLKKTGTVWVNLGDTYYGGGRNANNHNPKIKSKSVRGLVNLGDTVPGPKGQAKSLAQIPSRFAIAMASRGWILRNEIIWHKPNAMPSSATDRFTVDFEKMFFFTKSRQYYFEQQVEPYTKPLNRWGGPKTKENDHSKGEEFAVQERPDCERRPNPNGRNMRCVWDISTTPFAGAHFAVFPEELVRTPILAGCPSGGIVLDPFAGSGTTLVVAEKLKRKGIGIELNPEYIKIINTRLQNIQLPL